MSKLHLPFKVGERIESRSFDQGYRGAWFRCTIKGHKKIRGSLHYDLEYYDFPDEAIISEQIYRKPSNDSKSKKQLMMRPFFPPIHRESKMPDPNTISDTVVIVDDAWKVGDLVDWFTTGCYWSGTITEILGNEMVQIDLLPPPAGEGSSYEASCEDLRPSLDWSQELGWTVPLPMDKEKHHCCARLMKPMSTGRTDTQVTTYDSLQDNSRISAGSSPSQGKSEIVLKRPRSITESMEKDKSDKNTGCEVDKTDSGIEITSCSDAVPAAKRTRRITESEEKGKLGKNTDSKDTGIEETSCSDSIPTSKRTQRITESKEKEKADKSTNFEVGIEDRDITKTSSDSVSSSFTGDPSGETIGAIADTEQHNVGSLKKTEAAAEVEQCSGESLKETRNIETIPLNSTYSDSLEAAFIDLEELANRVKWLKGILQFGGASTPTMHRPRWKFLEHRASSTPR